MAALARAAGRAAGRGRPAPPARVHAGRDRADAGAAARDRQLAPAAGARPPRRGAGGRSDETRRGCAAAARGAGPRRREAAERRGAGAGAGGLRAAPAAPRRRRGAPRRRGWRWPSRRRAVGGAAALAGRRLGPRLGRRRLHRRRAEAARDRAWPTIPGGGRLLVQSQAGPWVVRPDGSRRLLGDYGEATWSPHGLFVAAAAGRTLSAVEPDGTPHWSLSAHGAGRRPALVAVAAYRIAYRAGAGCGSTAADGSDDRPGRRRGRPGRRRPGRRSAAWRWPTSTRAAAAADRRRRERRAARPRRRRWPAIRALEWGDATGRDPAGSSRSALRLRPARFGKLERPRSGSAAPAAARCRPAHRVRDAALAPRRRHGRRRRADGAAAGAARADSVLVYAAAGAPRRLSTVPGRLSRSRLGARAAARLLVAWPGADEWLFLPLRRRRGPRGRPTSPPPSRRASRGAVAFPQRRGLVLPHR